jgi:cytochrome P450
MDAIAPVPTLEPVRITVLAPGARRRARHDQVISGHRLPHHAPAFIMTGAGLGLRQP